MIGTLEEYIKLAEQELKRSRDNESVSTFGKEMAVQRALVYATLAVAVNH